MRLQPPRLLTLMTAIALMFSGISRGQEPEPELISGTGLSPAEGLASIQVREGFKVELVVAEPLVKDPVAFDWSADGRLWVVEMADYPLGTEGGGRVRVLEDKDGDGSYDTSTVFLDGLPYPNGIMPWREGVLISCAPEIRYTEDTNGDGRADRVEVLYTGLAEANPQHRVNGFSLALDGWVHAADADGGTVRSTRSEAEIEVRGRDIRFRPDDGAIEPESGRSQFGRRRNDWGDWLINTNSLWAWHVVLSDADLRRNRAFAASATTRVLEPDTRLYPVSQTLARFNDPGSANRATSACSPEPYRDDLFGPAFSSSLFISEPVHNLVHRMVLESEGATYSGRRAEGEETAEFLASTDHWFRPTSIRTGPDGALWIADMQRAVIEHPEWIPDDWERQLNLRAGEDRGRIYRVLPSDRSPRPIPKLDQLDTVGLVDAMDSPNGWQRDTIQRLLMHREDPAALGPLRQLISISRRPEVRVQAIWTLACLGGLDAGSVRRALVDDHAEVRRAAILATRLGDWDNDEVAAGIASQADDPSPRVRFAAALALGDWPDLQAGEALARIALRDGDDPWFRVAVLSSARLHATAILSAMLTQNNGKQSSANLWIGPLFAAAAREAGPEGPAGLVRSLVNAIGEVSERDEPAAMEMLARLLDEAGRLGLPLARWSEPSASLEGEVERIGPLVERAREVAAEESRAEEDRLAAIGLLGREPVGRTRDRVVLAALLRPQESVAIARAAVDAVSRLGSEEVPELLLKGWKGHGPTLRSAILDTLLGRDAWRDALLDAFEEGEIPAAEVGPSHRAQLMGHRDTAIRERAERLWGASNGERTEVVSRVRRVLAMGSDPEVGRAVFVKHCSTCHQLDGEGVAVGPDLTVLSDRSPEALLVAILDPSRAVEARYAAYTLATTDGRVVSGLIAEETSNAVTLLRQGGERDTLLRSEIEEIATTGQSLMPEGMEQDIQFQELAHLIAFLCEHGLRPNEVPGNRPTRVSPGRGGVVRLSADTAEIYGNRLTFEPTHQNLGWWIQENDRAAWTFEIDQAGTYDLSLEWACPDEGAGGAFVIEVGADRVAGSVVGTGSWDDYKRITVGTVTLGEGRHRLEIRPAVRPRGPLMDLRAIELRPTPNEVEESHL
ncbi:PVC-type heme-binding CxxCH protein [Tautonia rosea]|uniref:PVC-type heme-binding CxxCH protein n=1 Tax=Tautonia rosea TaxID=2728037 RepID=UPI00147398E3|nr:PVC-type heme-binding CxxCH protein [Tautonia rosea]